MYTNESEILTMKILPGQGHGHPTIKALENAPIPGPSRRGRGRGIIEPPAQNWGKMSVTVQSDDLDIFKDDEMEISNSDGQPIGRISVRPQVLPRRSISLTSVPTRPIRGSSGIFDEEEDDSHYTRPTVPKEEFEFKDMTLDDIIKLKKRVAEHASDLKYPGASDSGSDAGFSDKRPTPITIMRLLSEQGVEISTSVKELTCLLDKSGEETQTPKKVSREHRWRSEWTCGDLTGIGEGGRRILAEQAGALHLAQQLKINDPTIPDCRIPLGCLLSPFVFICLDNLVQNYAVPEYQTQVTTLAGGKKKYTCLCFINDDTFIGESNDPTYAKRFAAKKAYDSISGTSFKLDSILTGDKCFKENEFTEWESESTQVYNINSDGNISKMAMCPPSNPRKRTFSRTSTVLVRPKASPSNSRSLSRVIGGQSVADDSSPIANKKSRRAIMVNGNLQIIKQEENDAEDFLTLEPPPSLEIYDLRVYDELEDTDIESDDQLEMDD